MTANIAFAYRPNLIRVTSLKTFTNTFPLTRVDSTGSSFCFGRLLSQRSPLGGFVLTSHSEVIQLTYNSVLINVNSAERARSPLRGSLFFRSIIRDLVGLLEQSECKFHSAFCIHLGIKMFRKVGKVIWNLVDERGFEPPASSLRTVGKIS
jgi:hypothetical protein